VPAALEEPPTAEPPPVGPEVEEFAGLGTLEGTDDGAPRRGRPPWLGPTVKPVRPARTKTAAATAANAAMARLLVKISFGVLAANAGTSAGLGSGKGCPKVREAKTSSSVA